MVILELITFQVNQLAKKLPCPTCAFLEKEVAFLRDITTKLLDQNAQLRGIYVAPEPQQSQPDEKSTKALANFFGDIIGSEEDFSNEQNLGINQS